MEFSLKKQGKQVNSEVLKSSTFWERGVGFVMVAYT